MRSRSPSTAGSLRLATNQCQIRSTVYLTVPKEYIDKYKGQFDDGYEAYREWVLARMIEKGVLPSNTELTELNPMTPGTFVEGDSVRPWAELSEEEKSLFCRMAEVKPRCRSTPTSRSGGDRLSGGIRSTGQHPDLLLLINPQDRLVASGRRCCTQ
jgi:hypothetical protein